MSAPIVLPSRTRAHIWSPLARMVVGGLVVGGSVAVTQSVVHLLRGTIPLAAYYLVFLLASALVATGAYRGYVHVVEHRRAEELAGRGALGEIGVGVLIGVALVAAVIGVLWLAGDYHVSGTVVSIGLLGILANDGAGAVVEELLLRAIVFRIAEGMVGTWGALLISAVLFGVLHAGQPAAIPVALAAGVLLSAAYALTRRLWLAVGLHFGWDLAQDGLFNVAAGTSGLVRVTVAGPAWLSGGAVGLEGSVLALAVVVAAAVYLLIQVRSRGNLTGPTWSPPRSR